MTGGSQQQRQFRIALRDGADLTAAAEAAGISLAEARMLAAEDAKNPPPPEAYALLGHNRPESQMTDTISANQLRLLIERIERLEEEKRGISDDIKDVYAEAKSTGFDTKTMRRIIARRKLEQHQATEQDALFATYAAALGMQLAFDL